MKEALIKAWQWFLSLFTTRYTVSVSYNSQWGDSDDRIYHNVKKIIRTTDKLLEFTDEEGNRVVIRSAAGLNYRIEVI
tara:strand:- start:22775 stop:23008 length:234 start_codon:yes stop_codon:yes gene_type:complete